MSVGSYSQRQLVPKYHSSSGPIAQSAGTDRARCCAVSGVSPFPSTASQPRFPTCEGQTRRTQRFRACPQQQGRGRGDGRETTRTPSALAPRDTYWHIAIVNPEASFSVLQGIGAHRRHRLLLFLSGQDVFMPKGGESRPWGFHVATLILRVLVPHIPVSRLLGTWPHITSRYSLETSKPSNRTVTYDCVYPPAV